MAQVTAVPEIELVARQGSGLDLNSLLTAGLSVFSSITSELSLSASEESSSPTQTSDTGDFPFQTSSQSPAVSTSGSQTTSSYSSSISSTSSTTTGSSSSSTSSFKASSTTTSATSNKGSPNQTNSGNGSSHKVPIIVGVILGIIVLCLLGLLIYLCIRRRRRNGVIFSKRRNVTPSIDSDSEIGDEALVPVFKEPDVVETSPYHQYPPIPPSNHLTGMRRYGGNSGYAANGNAMNDISPPFYNHRSSRRSLPLDSVNEQPEMGRNISQSEIPYGGRRWSSSSGNGYVNGAPGVPPRSPQRRSIPRKPVPSSVDDGNHGFDFGLPPSNGFSQAGGGSPGRYYDRGRRPWRDDSQY
jgi:hypothetical protein